MSNVSSPLQIALQLILRFDADLRAIILLSLQVSLTASVRAFAIGARRSEQPWRVYRFPGLGTPIVIALVYRIAVGLWRAYGDSLLVSGASRLRVVRPLMSMGREGLLTAFLAASPSRKWEPSLSLAVTSGNTRAP
jgi:tungstate transport system permease protein